MKTILRRTFNPLRFFLRDSRAVGVILIVCTALSLILSNSFLGDSYRNFWNAELFSLGHSQYPPSISRWINDFLMAFFFLLAGMEIKRTGSRRTGFF